MEYNIPGVTLTVGFGSIFSILYVAVFVAFVLVVVGNYEILNGYPRSDLKPGTFVSDRYGYGEIFLIMTLCKGVLPFIFLYTLYDFMNFYKRNFFDFIVVWVFVLDLVLFVFFAVCACLLCNSPTSTGSPCNAPLAQWCQAYSANNTDRCVPQPVTLKKCDLPVNPVFVNWIIFVLVMTILDYLLYRFNNDMENYVQKHLIRTQYVE